MLKGTTALVTGATQGIGAAVAALLVREGADLLIAARNQGRLQDLSSNLACGWRVADLTTDSGLDDLQAAAQERFGGAPDLVVGSAGFFELSAAHETSGTAFDQMLTLNLKAEFELVRRFLPDMVARASGHFIHVGSIAGRKALPGNLAYSASKFGLRGMHEVLVEELAGTGVRSTLIEPGAVDTPLWDALDPDSNPNLPSRAQMLRPEDVAAAVLFAAGQPSTVALPLIQIQRA